MAPGNIIVLNGTSSSGKTTLAKALQRQLDEPYLHLGNDQFLHPNAPERLITISTNGSHPVAVEGWLAVFDENRLVDLQVGSLGIRWVRGMYLAMAAWAQAGNHLIADVVMHDERIVQAAAEVFHGLPAWLVSVYCPRAIVEQREQQRAERRAPGGASVFYDEVYRYTVYDLRVDTARSTPEECAELIQDMLNRPPRAFRELHRQFMHV